MVKTSKNILVKAAGLMLGATMLMASVLGGTMAYYKVTGTSKSAVSIDVGNWDIKINGTQVTKETDVDELIDLDTMTFKNDGAKAKGQDYTPSGSLSEVQVVPGTLGFKAVTIRNNSPVDAKITLSMSGAENESGGIKVGISSTDPSQLDGPTDYTTLTGEEGLLVKAGDPEITAYIYFIWEYTDNANLGTNVDADTALGLKEDGKVNFGTFKFEAVQDGPQD